MNRDKTRIVQSQVQPGTSMFSRIRRNHGLEHATLNVLARSYPSTSLAGHSDFNGFWIIGNVPQEALASAAAEALARLRAGERYLAIHPGCGTNYATSGVLAGSAAALAMLGAGKRKRDWLERLPLATMLATLALIVSQPLGMAVQANLTTSGEPGDLRITQIKQSRQGRFPAFRILTQG
jgi:hypothetical protein